MQQPNITLFSEGEQDTFSEYSDLADSHFRDFKYENPNVSLVIYFNSANLQFESRDAISAGTFSESQWNQFLQPLNQDAMELSESLKKSKIFPKLQFIMRK